MEPEIAAVMKKGSAQLDESLEKVMATLEK